MPGNSDARPRRMQLETCLEQVRKTVPTVQIYIVESKSVLRFRNRQVHWIGWILRAPNSRMLAFLFKYSIDARIGGWNKATYLEIESDTPEEPKTLT